MNNKLTAIAIAALIPLSILTISHKTNSLPKCEEDEVITGRGDFSHGKWDRYVCDHPDNLETEVTNQDLPLGPRLQRVAGDKWEVIYVPTSGYFQVEAK